MSDQKASYLIIDRAKDDIESNRSVGLGCLPSSFDQRRSMGRRKGSRDGLRIPNALIRWRCWLSAMLGEQR